MPSWYWRMCENSQKKRRRFKGTSKQSKAKAKPSQTKQAKDQMISTSRWRASSSSCLSSLVMSLWCSCDKQLRILPSSSSSPEHSCWVFIGNKNSFKLLACLHAYDHRLGLPTKLFKIQAFLHACYYCLDCQQNSSRSEFSCFLACLLLVCLQTSFLMKCPTPAWTSIPISYKASCQECCSRVLWTSFCFFLDCVCVCVWEREREREWGMRGHWYTHTPGVLLKQRSANGLRRMRSKHQIDSLILQGMEDLKRTLAELVHQASESLFQIRLGECTVLVSDVACLGLLLHASPVRDLHFLRQVRQVEQVREGTGHQYGVSCVQRVENLSQLFQFSEIPRSFLFSILVDLAVHPRYLVTLLHLQQQLHTTLAQFFCMLFFTFFAVSFVPSFFFFFFFFCQKLLLLFFTFFAASFFLLLLLLLHILLPKASSALHILCSFFLLSFFLLLLLLQKASSAAAAASLAVSQLVIEQSKLVCLIAVSICHSNCLRPERKLKTRFNTHMHQSINLLFGFLEKNSDSPPYSSGIMFLCCWLCEELRENGSLLSDSPPHSSAIVFLCWWFVRELRERKNTPFLRSQERHCENGRRFHPPITRQSTLRERIAYSGHTKDRQTVIDRERDDDGHDHAELDLLQHSWRNIISRKALSRK